MQYRIQVNTVSDRPEVWTGNAKLYDSAEEAETAARDLFKRWTAVRYWRVLEGRDKEISRGG